MSKKKKQKKDGEKPKVNPELEGFDVDINEFGEITSAIDMEKINAFLDKNLYDKKLENLPKEEEEEDKKDEDDDS